MHTWIQTMVDVLIIVMASILILFALGLIVLHIITTSNSKRVEQIKRRIMRMLSVKQDLEFLREQIHQLLDQNGEVHSLEDIRGIQSNRGAIAITIVVDEINESQRELLRSIILQDQWYMAHIRKKLHAGNSDWVGVFTKLVAELRLSVLDEEVLANLYRWPKKSGQSGDQPAGFVHVRKPRQTADAVFRPFVSPDPVLPLPAGALRLLYGRSCGTVPDAAGKKPGQLRHTFVHP